jgi:alkylation response protein AidB-like acyl-CoA dehydrogenase
MSAGTDTELAAEFELAAQELADDLLRRHRADGDPDPDGTERRGFAAAVEAGWCGALLPEELGGLGLGLVELGGIFKVVGSNLFAGPLLEHAVAFPLLLASTPDAERAAALAPRLEAGRTAALVDAAALGGPSPRLTEGRLEGSVDCVRFAGEAETLVVCAVAADAEAVAVLPADRAGIAIEPMRSFDPAMSVARVSFEGATVEPGELLVEPGEVDLAPVRDGLRLMISCEQAGLAERTLERATEYAKERHQFGRPIGSFQAIQQILAEMSRRSLLLDHVWREAVPAAGVAAGPIAARVAKVAAALYARGVVEDALQVHGGVAFTLEYDLHRYYKRVLTLQGLYGGVELADELTDELLAPGNDPWPAFA